MNLAEEIKLNLCEELKLIATAAEASMGARKLSLQNELCGMYRHFLTEWMEKVGITLMKREAENGKYQIQFKMDEPFDLNVIAEETEKLESRYNVESDIVEACAARCNAWETWCDDRGLTHIIIEDEVDIKWE